MRLLVTGGAGYVGSHTVRAATGAGHEVWVYDDLVQGHAQAVPADRLVQGRLNDPKLLAETLRQHHIEAVLHFAALCLVGESVRLPARYWRNNVEGTLALVECMRESGVECIVFSSTCAVYGVPESVPITENESRKPLSPYGSSKLACEHLLADYARSFGMAAMALRYFNAAGASPEGDIGEDHDPETHLIPLVLQTALEQRPAIQILGTDYPTPDGTCIRDYVHVDDLAEAHLLALERLQPGRLECINLGTGKGYSVQQVVEAARAVTGRPIATEAHPRREGDPPELVAAAAKARRELGWRPRYTDIEAIIETAWRWHRNHPNGYDA
jgi:UDP-glucose 4-epimerase